MTFDSNNSRQSGMANYSGNATVKVRLFFLVDWTNIWSQSVLSGDTIVLVGKATNGPPPEITLTLNDIQCPKVARGSQQTDEEYAWQSREFLRNLCIGKPVSFSVTQRAPTINRTFGYAMLNGENLSKVPSLQCIIALMMNLYRLYFLPDGLYLRRVVIALTM